MKFRPEVVEGEKVEKMKWDFLMRIVKRKSKRSKKLSIWLKDWLVYSNDFLPPLGNFFLIPKKKYGEKVNVIKNANEINDELQHK